MSTYHFDQQREQILLQQQATPKLNKMFPTSSEGNKNTFKFNEQATQNSHNETASGAAFWDDINMSQNMMRAPSDASKLINQSIEEEFGSAQDYSFSIQNKQYNANKVAPPLQNNDFSVNGEFINVSLNDSSDQQQPLMGNQHDMSSQMIYPKTNVNEPPSPEWIPDEASPNCYECKEEFSFFNRRHHCEICRKVFCKKHSSLVELLFNGQNRKLRACKKCIKQHKQYNDAIKMQKVLLTDKIPIEQRRAQSYHFQGILSQEKPTTPMDIQNVEGKPEYYTDSVQQQKQRNDIGSALDMSDLGLKQNDQKNQVFAFDQHLKIAERQQQVARQSATNKKAMDDFLNAENIRQENNSQTQQLIDQSGSVSNRVTDKHTNEWLNHKLRCHLDAMIDQVIEDHKIESHRWRKILANCTKHAVMTVRPSSRMLKDSIDFNSFIKIVTIQHHNQEKCQYINGIVFKKDVANRRMSTQIENPKVLVLNNSLGYVQDDDGFVDMQAEIDQQESFMKIIRQKILSLNPSIIFIEKDASRPALETLLQDGITVVTVTSAKMLKMIARATQTIVCPSINLLDRNFSLGQCLDFRVEHTKPINEAGYTQIHHSLSDSTSLMFLEGCQAKLGCSIVLSGPDPVELKQVRKALKFCLKTARILLLEREMFRYFVPEIQQFRKVSSSSEDETEDKKQIEEDHNELSFQQTISENLDPEKRSMSYAIGKTSLGRKKADFDSQFDDYESPFLFQKHMQRGKIVFEKFSLVQPNKTDNPEGNKNGQNKSKNNISVDSANRNSGEYIETIESPPNQVKEEIMSEQVLRKKLKNMCKRPQRTIINFLKENEDMSFCTFLSDTKAKCEVEVCQDEPTCKMPFQQHTDYWYHGEGCVQIKKQVVDPDFAKNLRSSSGNKEGVGLVSGNFDQLVLETPTFMSGYCLECKRLVLDQDRIPNELLEISFFKLLEQFFYNPRIQISKARDQESMGGDPICSHSLFRQCELQFRFGSIHISIRFEKLDGYSLDMFHFGLQKGSVTEECIDNQITSRLQELRGLLLDTFTFLLNQLDHLFNFMENGMEEIKRLAGDKEWINIVCVRIIEFLNLFKTNTSNYMVFVFAEVFVEQMNPDNMTQFEHLDTKTTDKHSNEFIRKGKLVDIKTHMQFNRLHKILSARACEYLFILRNLNGLVKNTFISGAFPKKNPFQEIDTQLKQQKEAASNAANLAKNQVDKQLANVFDVNLITSNLTNSQENRIGLTSQPLRRSTMEMDSQSSFIGNSGNIVSQNVKQMYLELATFEYKMRENKSIADLVEQNQFIPAGFNQNCIQLVKFEGGGQKKSMDFASLIASALSSNLYLNGLSNLEYLNLNNSIKSYNGIFSTNRESMDANEIILAAKEYDQNNSSKVQISPDVMNHEVPIEAIEQEMLSDTTSSFKISYSTFQPLANLEVHINEVKQKTIYNDNEETPQFYSNCEQIGDWSSIEVPVDQSIFNSLIELHDFVLLSALPPEKRSRRQSSLDEAAIEFKQVGQLKPRLSIAADNATQLFAAKKQNQLKDNIKTDYSKILTHEFAYRDIYHIFHERIDFFVKIFCPTHFEALRKLYCGPYNAFLHSIFRSDIWKDNTGGKSNSTFFKSFDNKYILKAVEAKEIKMFNSMSSSYFEYLSRSFSSQCPTSLAKTLGMFRITIKRGKITEHYSVQLLENVLLGVDDNVCIKYDLKGSRRNRYIPRTKQGQVTLDNNLLYDRKSRPIPMQYQMKRLMKIAIANDSLYLTKHSIIDYSMLVIINPIEHTVRLGIIDYIQQYTLEKELESYLKQTISNVDPTILPPESYKQRFRTAMDQYFIALLPDVNENLNETMVSKFQAKKINWVTKEGGENSLRNQLKHKILQKVWETSKSFKESQQKQ